MLSQLFTQLARSIVVMVALWVPGWVQAQEMPICTEQHALVWEQVDDLDRVAAWEVMVSRDGESYTVLTTIQKEQEEGEQVVALPVSLADGPTWFAVVAVGTNARKSVSSNVVSCEYRAPVSAPSLRILLQLGG